MLVVAICLFSSRIEYAASRAPVRARYGMVASTSEIASRAGVEVLKKGGNAVDAAVVVALVLAVIWPEAGNLGGGGFMLIRMADGTAEAIDYRERAPLAASRDMYLDEKGNVIQNASIVGHKAVGVPGTVAGLSLALQRFGKLQWNEAIEPARKLASNGFVLSAATAHSICSSKEALAHFSESRRIFLPDGECPEEGELFVQGDLAATLTRLQHNGPGEFYEGETARRIVTDMKENRGLITMQDLKIYEPVIRRPLHSTYRGYEILTMPPPSSGGVALIEMLNVLECFDVSSLGFHSSDHIHLLVETMRRAFADRAELLGDPDFVSIPAEKLLSKEYAATMAKTIDFRKATSSTEIRAGGAAPVESKQTTHFTIVDQRGNIVSNTYTLNDSFGSGVTARGTGILLNNEMDDFTSKPGVPNLYGLLQGEANAIAPRKRPLSSMTPTIVLKEGRPYFAVGSPGGPTIINTVLQVIVNILDFGMNIQEAIDAPRLHHQWMPDEIYMEPFTVNKDARTVLEMRGNKFAGKSFFTSTPYLGDAQGILIERETGMRLGVSDSREAGTPVGY